MSFDISRIFATLGSTLFYCGIAGTALSLLLMLLLTPIFAAEKKRLIKKIDSEYNKKNG